MRGLTQKQRAILEIIKINVWEKHRPPTLQEIGDVLGTSSTNIYFHVNALIRKGYIKRIPNVARGIDWTGKE